MTKYDRFLFDLDFEFFVGGEDFKFAGFEPALAPLVHIAEVAETVGLEAEGGGGSGRNQALLEELEFLVGAGDGADRVADVPEDCFLTVSGAVVIDIDLKDKRRVRDLAYVAVGKVRVAQTMAEPVHRFAGNVLIEAHERTACAASVVVNRNLSGGVWEGY